MFPQLLQCKQLSTVSFFLRNRQIDISVTFGDKHFGFSDLFMADLDYGHKRLLNMCCYGNQRPRCYFFEVFRLSLEWKDFRFSATCQTMKFYGNVCNASGDKYQSQVSTPWFEKFCKSSRKERCRLSKKSICRNSVVRVEERL